MNCHNCHHPNRPEAKFCDNCGTPLHQLTTEPNLTLTAERKMVTVMFADISGFTALSETLDPELVRDLMNSCFDQLVPIIRKYRGTVDKFIGDEIMALFGAPISHENDPERALRTALEIIEALNQFNQLHGTTLEMHIGIETGLVVAGGVGATDRQQYSVMGNTVNMAARLKDIALPSIIAVGPGCYEKSAPIFNFSTLPAVSIKGKSEPMTIYQLIDLKQTPGRVRGIQGLETRMIGRDQEMSQLNELMFHLEKEKKGRIVSIIGEAGLGKSRLISELTHKWQMIYPNAHWLESYGLAHEATIPYGQFQQLMSQQVHIVAQDSIKQRQIKLGRFISEFPYQQQTFLQQIFSLLLSLPLPIEWIAPKGDALKQALREAMELVLIYWSKTNPAAIIFDDLHWADPASIKLLTQLLPAIKEKPILLITVFRPEKNQPCWQFKEETAVAHPDRFSQFQLRPLSHGQGEQLVDELLTIANLPQELRQLILMKTDGNPFFIEEIIRTLIDEKIVIRSANGTNWSLAPNADYKQIMLPDNLQSLLTARIDRLDKESRQTLQIASVIGHRFYYRVLHQLRKTPNLEGQLNTLQEHQLVLEAMQEPEREFVFRHVLTQEAAYETILLKQRKIFHLNVGDSLEQIFPNRLDEFAALLAQHFAQAEDPRAFSYFLKAGDIAFQLYAHPETIAHYTAALTAAQQHQINETEQLTYIYLRLGRALELNSQFHEALALYQQMEQEAARHKDQRMRLAGLVEQTVLYATPTPLFNYETAQKLAEESLSLAQSLNDPWREARVHWCAINFNRFFNSKERQQDGLDSSEKALTILANLGYTLDQFKGDISPDARPYWEQLAYVYHDTGYIHMTMKMHHKAKEKYIEAQQMWRALDNRPMLTDSLTAYSIYQCGAYEYDKAIALSNEAAAISKGINNLWGQSFSKMLIGAAYLAQGDFDIAAAVCEEAIRLSKQSGFTSALSTTPLLLAIIYKEFDALDSISGWLDELLIYVTENAPAMKRSMESIIHYVHFLQGDQETADLLFGPEWWGNLTTSFVIVNIGIKWSAEMCLVYEREDVLEKLLKNFEIQKSTFVTDPLLFFEADYYQARIHLLRQEPALAYPLLIQAAKGATLVGHKQFLWQINGTLAKTAVLLDQPLEATHYRAEAEQGAQYIASRISNPEFKAGFLRQVARHLSQ